MAFKILKWTGAVIRKVLPRLTRKGPDYDVLWHIPYEQEDLVRFYLLNNVKS